MTEIIPPVSRNNPLRRWLPLGVLGALVATAYAFGLHKYISLQVVAENQQALLGYVREHLIYSLLIYAVIYIGVVALSLPGAGILSIVGGFVFGWVISAPVTVVAATIGAAIVFQIVKTSLGATMAEKAGPFVARLSGGFANDAFNYLLFLRLVPLFPFFAVNAVAGIARVNLHTFIIATFFGIIPGSIAFAWLGRGLGSVIDAQTAVHNSCIAEKGLAACPFEISAAALITPQLFIAFCVLGGVALIPVAHKKWKSIS
jgi:uncharacterized membrane protein YdjX (TVP38/TMEM64 family)